MATTKKTTTAAATTKAANETTFVLTDKAQMVAARETLQRGAITGSDWRKGALKAPSLRNGAIATLAAAAGKDGTIVESAALAALAGINLGTGTPRSFLKAFVASGYVMVEQQ